MTHILVDVVNQNVRVVNIAKYAIYFSVIIEITASNISEGFN